MAPRKSSRRTTVGSTSRQLNYLYNSESKTISSFNKLAKKFFAQGSYSMRSTIGIPADINVVATVDTESGTRTDRMKSFGRQSRQRSTSSSAKLREAIMEQLAKKSAPKKTAKKAAPKKAAKKAVKKAAPKKAAKKAAKKA